MNKELILKLHSIGAIKFGEFKLKSGILSPIYCDLSVIISYPKILQKIAGAMWTKIAACSFELICGVPYKAIPIATAISLGHNKPMVLRRKEVKDYGTKKIVEGKFQPGQTCLVIEDTVTSGISIFETIEPLEKAGLVVKDIVILIDREQGGKKHIMDKGYNLHTVLTLTEILETLEQHNILDKNIVEQTKNFIQTHQV